MTWTAATARALALGLSILALPAAVRATDAPATPAPASAEAPLADAATLDGDEKVVEAALAAGHAGGPGALKAHIEALRLVLAHTPDPYNKVEKRPGVVYYRTGSAGDADAFTLRIVAEAAQAKTSVRVVRLADPYPTAAALIGSYNDETGHFDEALAALDKGHAIAPSDANVTIERGAALSALHRWADALADYSDGLAALGPDGPPTLRGFLLRGQGFTLTELKRYDEAEAAYRESLKVDPNHGVATQELAYIARVRGGGAPTATGLFVNKPKP